MPRELTQEERERRSEWAKEAHGEIVVDPETGIERRKFGGPQPRSGRPRKPRASQLIAAEVEKEAEKIREKLFEIAYEAPSAGERRKALLNLLEVEERERAIEVEEEKELRQMKRDELVNELLKLRAEQDEELEGKAEEVGPVLELEEGEQAA